MKLSRTLPMRRLLNIPLNWIVCLTLMITVSPVFGMKDQSTTLNDEEETPPSPSTPKSFTSGEYETPPSSPLKNSVSRQESLSGPLAPLSDPDEETDPNGIPVNVFLASTPPTLMEELRQNQTCWTDAFHQERDREARMVEKQLFSLRSAQNFSMRIHDTLPRPTGRPIAIFEGGGVRGIATGREINRMSDATGVEVSKMFAAVGGTSVGSILAGSIATRQYTGSDIENIFGNNAQQIFSQSYWRSLTSFGGLVRPQYDRQYLDQILYKHLGDYRLSDLEIPFAAVAVGREVRQYGRLGNPEPIVFRTYDARNNTQLDIGLHTATGVSASAPGYFAEKEFIYDGKVYKGMDGGLIANSPRLEVIMNAIDSWGGLTPDDMVLTFGTGIETMAHAPVGWIESALYNMNPFNQGGLLENASAVLGSFMEAQTMRSEQNTTRLLRAYGIKHNYTLDFKISKRSLDDASDAFKEELLAAAETAVQEWKDKDTVHEVIRHYAEAWERKDSGYGGDQ